EEIAVDLETVALLGPPVILQFLMHPQDGHDFYPDNFATLGVWVLRSMRSKVVLACFCCSTSFSVFLAVWSSEDKREPRLAAAKSAKPSEDEASTAARDCRALAMAV